MKYEPQDPEYEAKVRASFERQSIMRLIGAELRTVEPGYCEIELPYREELTQQHDYLHAGATTTIADSSGGYAAFSLMPPGSSILTIEFKVNLLAPAKGERFLARGRVIKPGGRLYICEFQVEAIDGEHSRTCLFGMQTNMCLPATADGPPG